MIRHWPHALSNISLCLCLIGPPGSDSTNSLHWNFSVIFLGSIGIEVYPGSILGVSQMLHGLYSSFYTALLGVLVGNLLGPPFGGSYLLIPLLTGP